MTITNGHGQATTGVEAELLARVHRLSLEQKVRLLTGATVWTLYAEPAIGLRSVVVSDGPAGVRGQAWDERSPSANVPSPTALAASWDEDRVTRIGRLLASEARRKGVDVLLAPTVNLHRTPYGGRHFENLSEDPLLTARIGAAYVRGVQAGGVAATVKHFVANDSETERFTLDAVLDERTLRELYLAAFEPIVRDAGAWAVMAAYNGVNGATMTENPLLRDVLKQEWGFSGVVMSDWFAARSVAAAGDGLLDLAMPGPNGPWGDALVAAVRDGEIPAAAIDDKVLRILRLAARVGALDGIAPAVEPAPPWSAADISAELRSAAAAGFVLTRNTGGLLPLTAGTLRTVAVLGPNAAVARTLGGGSATVFPPYVSAPLAGLRAALGADATVTYAPGSRVTDRVPAAPLDWLSLPDGSGAGVRIEFLDADATVLGQQDRQAASFLWWGPIVPDLNVSDVTSVEIQARLRVPESGDYLIGASGLGSFHLSVDGHPVLDAVAVLPEDADIVESITKPPQVFVPVTLAAGTDASVLLRYVPQVPEGAPMEADGGIMACQLNIARQLDDRTEFDRAVRLAAQADVAVVVVGTTEEVESEGFDRTGLALPGRQDELVRAVAAANPRTVVVVNAGAPVLLPWADEVPAILLAWFPGQEFGNALADVLLGHAEPGGRLPTTWPRTDDGHPSATPVDGTLRYDEGLSIGYRAANRAPLFCFGHGLGYTGWDYLGIDGPTAVAAGAELTVTVRLGNTGGRAGGTVVQVYASRPDSAVERPARWLVGFATVTADPGQQTTATVRIDGRAFQHWVPGSGWQTEAGTFGLEAGASVADLPLSAEVHID